MALIYNIEDDIRYQEGKEEGLKVAIKALLEFKFPLQKIADSLQVSLEFVKKVAETLKK